MIRKRTFWQHDVKCLRSGFFVTVFEPVVFLKFCGERTIENPNALNTNLSIRFFTSVRKARAGRSLETPAKNLTYRGGFIPRRGDTTRESRTRAPAPFEIIILPSSLCCRRIVTIGSVFSFFFLSRPSIIRPVHVIIVVHLLLGHLHT